MRLKQVLGTIGGMLALGVKSQEVAHSVRTEEAEVATLWLSRGDRMGIHKNAPLTPAGREILVRRVLDEGHTPMAVATAIPL